MSWDANTRVGMPANEQGRNRFWPSGSVSILFLHQDGARRQASVIQLVFGLLVHVVPGRVRGRHDGVCLHACQKQGCQARAAAMLPNVMRVAVGSPEQRLTNRARCIGGLTHRTLGADHGSGNGGGDEQHRLDIDGGIPCQ